MTTPIIRRRGVGGATRPDAAAGQQGERDAPLLAGLDLSPSFAAFLVYVFVITTYRLPVGTAAMSVALLALPLEPRPLRFPPFVLCLAALLGWAFLGWGTSEYPTLVWDHLIDFAKIGGVVLVAVNVLTTRARLRFFLLAYLAFFAFYPVRGALFNYFLYGGTMSGRAVWSYSYSNPNDLAGMCLLFVALAAGVLVAERTRWIRFCALAGVIVLPFLIVLTQSRGAFVALLAFGVIALRDQWRRGRMVLLTAAAIVAVLVAAPDSVWRRLGTLKEVANQDNGAQVADEGSAEQRLEIWKVARAIIADHPTTGVGLGAYPDAHYLYAQRPVFKPTAQGKRDTHSTYLNILAEMGIPGLILFGLIVALPLVKAEQVRRRIKSTHPARAQQLRYMVLGMVGYLVAGVWGSYGALVPTYLYLSLVFVAAMVMQHEELPLRRGVRFGGRGRTRAAPATASPIVRRKVR
jgi:probable O-glycosylation ligase (exosortase A-associated)